MSSTSRPSLITDPANRVLGDFDMLIGGKAVPSSSGERFDSFDPSTGEVIGSAPSATAADVDQAVAAARSALAEWAATPGFVRGMIMNEFARLANEHADDITFIETLEAGYYIRKSRQMAAAVPVIVGYHAGLADKIGGRTIDVPGGQLDFTLLEPLGVTAHILPWNFPLGLMARSIAPALAAGNTVIVKPAEQSPLGALAIARLFEEAGFPPGAVNVVTGDGEVGAALASHPGVDAITFTGSVPTGKKVAAAANDRLAHVNLELGGKGPNIICADARLDDAVEASLQAIFSRSGQICLAASRVYVHRDVHDEFVHKFVERVKTIVVGDAMSEETNLGPIISEEQLESVLGFIESGRREGATVAFGGERVGDRGYFVQPTVFTGVTDDMTICREEIFGPVVAITVWDDIDDVVARANDSDYGLYGGVWSQDIDVALGIARRLECGSVAVNDFWNEAPQAPYGGYKQSGTNNSAEALEAIRGYTRTKNVVINTSGAIFGKPGLPEDWADGPL